jgi:phosphoglycerate dehydrogenase-like enzyme
VDKLKLMVVDPKEVSLATLPSDLEETKPLKIGIVGFGAFGQFLARRMSQNHQVSCIDKLDKVRLC